jgi:hypothetical protein
MLPSSVRVVSSIGTKTNVKEACPTVRTPTNLTHCQVSRFEGFNQVVTSMSCAGLVNLLPVHMIMSQEPTSLPPVVHLRRWWGGS